MKKRILITEFMDEAAVETLRNSYNVLYDPGLGIQRPALLDAVADVDALIVRNRTAVDKEVVSAAARLVAVGRLGVGLDNIDLDACASRGIAVLPAVGANALGVAEYVIATSMLLLRGFLFHMQEVADGGWPRAQLSDGRESAGRTLGIVGFGSIGQTVGGLARSVGMQVVAYDPVLAADHPAWQHAGRCGELDALFGRADVVSLHVPLTAGSRHLVDARRLALMRPGAVLINTARGGIVDEAALAAALASGKLAGAAVDVYEQEPLPAGSPLAGAPNLIMTPHIAGVTQESNVRVSSMIAQRIAAALG